MFFYRLKNCIAVWLAFFTVATCLFAVKVASVCKLEDCGGERVFYLASSSSQGFRKTRLKIYEIFRVKGESVRFSTEKTEKDFLQETLCSYQAEVRFIERGFGATSYYCYAEDLGGGLLLNEEVINLHIVWKEDEAVIGTPIIFDGY